MSPFNLAFKNVQNSIVTIKTPIDGAVSKNRYTLKSRIVD